jgi:hypothetical protein
MSNKLVNSLIWGLGRGIGNTASKRTTEYIGKKLYDPKSKFRKKIERFELGGDFNIGKRKMFTLIDGFHEEYIMNRESLPLFQVGNYQLIDIKMIETKLRMLEYLITNEESHRPQFESVVNYWNMVKNEI